MSNTPNLVKLIECPRDAWQALPKVIPAEVKTDYIQALIASGFSHIDAVSFVSPKAVPQMADSEIVLNFLDPADDVEIIGIVVNEKGAERAIFTGSVSTLGFPYSVSPSFLQRNQHQTPEESLDALEKIGELAYKSGLDLVAYISMAFGNPYGDLWNEEEVIEACSLLSDNGIRQISLADTVGLATADQIESLLSAVIAEYDSVEFGIHMHSRPDQSAEKITAAYQAGCRRFDSAIGGFGGCPFAQDALVGNIATETLVATLTSLGAELPRLRPLDSLVTAASAIASKFGASLQ